MLEEAREWMEELGAEAHLPEDWWRAQLPIIVPRSQVQEMLDCPELDANARLALRCQYQTGVRPEEVFQLVIEDNRLRTGSRWLAVDRETLAQLAAHPILGSPGDLEEWLRTAARHAGVDRIYAAGGRALTPAILRHAFISHALENGMDLICLYYQMGHRCISTTQMYLATALNFYRPQYQQFHPLCNQVRGGRQQPKITIAEALDLIEALPTTRGRLILRTLYAGALRNEEIRNLLCADVNLAEARLFLRDAKGPADAVALIDPETAAQLGRYMAGKSPEDPVFEDLKSAMTVWTLVRKAAQKTGIWDKYKDAGYSVSPHTLRHAYATHCYQQGMNPNCLSRLMGHWDRQSTLTYAECSPEHLRRSHQKAHPICAWDRQVSILGEVGSGL